MGKDTTGEGSGRLVVGVLGPQQGGADSTTLRSVRGKKGREHHHLPERVTGESFRDGFGEVCTVSRVEVHFPVAANNWSSQSRSLVRNDTG